MLLSGLDRNTHTFLTLMMSSRGACGLALCDTAVIYSWTHCWSSIQVQYNR